MWYETCQDISAGAELCLEPREPLNLQDMLGDSTDERETGEFDLIIKKNEGSMIYSSSRSPKKGCQKFSQN